MTSRKATNRNDRDPVFESWWCGAGITYIHIPERSKGIEWINCITSKSKHGEFTKTPTLISAYVYAKLRATSSLDALKSAKARAPSNTEILSQEIQATSWHGEDSRLKKSTTRCLTPLIGKPNFTLHLDRGQNLLWYPDLGR
jgi:hypothetical protein